MTTEERTAAFKARIDAGAKIKATDWMPDAYREAALAFIEMHANSEIMGTAQRGSLPAPDVQRRWVSEGALRSACR